MMDVGRHPRIELMAYSEVENVSGHVGNFTVRVRRKARYVDEDECTACGDCADVCPVVMPDEFQAGLSTRRAIYIPFAQAVPSSYIVNANECLGHNPIACGKCVEACDKECIDFDLRDEIMELQVGAIIVATGMEVYDPTSLDEYGYTSYENVITSLEFERLISAGGPTDGHFVRPLDQKRPKRIGFVQCVGSRTVPSESNPEGQRGNPYCSNICCMNTVKDSLLLKDHYPDTDITVFYIDIRAFGKGFEDLYRRSRAQGVRYIRGLPGEVEGDPGTGNLKVYVENTTTGLLEEHELDMVVLSIGAIPREETGLVRQLLTLSASEDGFLMEAHPKLKPVDTPTKGVYIAGCAEAPKDIKDSVTQAGAAAARAEVLLGAPQIAVEAITAVVDEDLCKQCGQCAEVCPFSAIVWEKKQTARVISAACAGCGTCAAECRFDAITMRHFTDQQVYAMIDAILEEDPGDGGRPADKMVIFACNWCSYAGADTAGTSRLQYPPNGYIIRTMCSGRVNPDFVWYAFQKGAPLVLVSGCHYVDCHYIDANRNTVRRVDALWEGLEKHGVDPRRLQLEWCSAAEGQKWARIIQELEGLRTEVTDGDVEEAREALAGKRVPRRSKVWQLEEPTPANMVCYRCGNQWEVTFDPAADRERMCSACRSNSVRVVSDGGK
jgi:heterodisulfide reductase subunit A